jgi:hypothetical protein
VRQAECAECRRPFALGTGFAVEGRTLCEACADTRVQALSAAGGKLPAGTVMRLVDPTVCGHCGRDNGSSELQRAGTVPLCYECEQTCRNRPFPGWLRTALVALVVLMVLSLWHDRRFVSAYMALARANHAFKGGDLDAAQRAMDEVKSRVPEWPVAAGMSSFYQGLRLLRDDRSVEAVAELAKARAVLGPGSFIEHVLLQARAGAAFDSHDYDGFLAREQDILKLRPADSFSEAGVASAYACKYAVSGDETQKAAALAHLEKAQKAGGDPAAFKEYEGRIRYRLATREIIDKKEYDRRFPQGWNGEK